MATFFLALCCLIALLALVAALAPGNDMISLFTIFACYYIGAPIVEIGLLGLESNRQFNIPDLNRFTPGFHEAIFQQTLFVVLTVLIALGFSAVFQRNAPVHDRVEYHLKWLTPRRFLLFSLALPAIYWTQIGITDRGLIGRGQVSVPIFLLLLDELYRTLAFVAIFASSKNQGLKFALISMLGGLMFGSRTAAIFPLIYWALHNQVHFFRPKIMFSAGFALLLLPFFKPFARWVTNLIIGANQNTLFYIFTARNDARTLVSDIDAALPMSWHAMSVHDPFFQQFAGVSWFNILTAPFPDFIFGFNKTSVPQESAIYVNPNYFTDPNGLGFSGIAELYISGPLSVAGGAILLAMILAAGLRYKNTILLAPLALFVFKFFRMDIASNLEKSVIFFGVMAFIFMKLMVRRKEPQPAVRAQATPAE